MFVVVVVVVVMVMVVIMIVIVVVIVGLFVELELVAADRVAGLVDDRDPLGQPLERLAIGQVGFEVDEPIGIVQLASQQIRIDLGRGCESVELLGDVVICPAVAFRNASEHGVAFEDEVALLVVHGLLHLLGMDHEEEGDAERMEALEEQLLRRFHRVSREA